MNLSVRVSACVCECVNLSMWVSVRESECAGECVCVSVGECA